MRISTKGRYGLAIMLALYKSNQSTRALDIAKLLGVSKIYLEQVFTALKNAKLVLSTKGANGGYSINPSGDTISAYDILRATEPALFEATEPSVKSAALLLEDALQSMVYNPLDAVVVDFLKNVSLKSLAEKATIDTDFMFYI